MPKLKTPNLLYGSGVWTSVKWQEWAEGFQTLEELQSVNLTPEDETRIKQLFSDEAGEEITC